MHMRNVPVRSEILGKDARDTEPDIKQIFITGVTDTDTFERTLYLVRKRIERRIDDKDFYIVSLSSKNIIYKGMLSSTQCASISKTSHNHISQAGWRWCTPASAPHVSNLEFGTAVPSAGA